MVEKVVNSAIVSRRQEIERRQNNISTHTPYEDLQKAKAAAEGEVRTHGGVKVRKVGGKWIPVAERREYPNKKEKKESKKPKAKAKESKKKVIPSHVSAQHVGALRHIKKLVNSNKFHEAHMLADKLPDDVKHEIPPKVWENMVKHNHEANMKAAEEEKKAE